MINENDIALIDAFIAGELIGNDKTDFEMRVKRDLEFAKAVRQQIHAVEHLEIYGAVQMGNALRADMNQWKQQGGYKAYKSDMLAKSRMIKVVASIVGLAVVAGAVWYFFLKEEPPTKKQEPVETETTVAEPESPGVYEQQDTLTEMQSLTELKTSEDQIADIQLNIKDPTSFSIVEMSNVDGIYTYQIAYDDQVQVIKSQDPDMDERLTKMANDAILENQQRTSRQTQSTTVKKQPAAPKTTKPAPVKTEEPPVQQPPKQQPKPTIKRTNEKVVDDIPY